MEEVGKDVVHIDSERSDSDGEGISSSTAGPEDGVQQPQHAAVRHNLRQRTEGDGVAMDTSDILCSDAGTVEEEFPSGRQGNKVSYVEEMLEVRSEAEDEFSTQRSEEEDEFRTQMDVLADFQARSGKSVVMSPAKFDSVLQYLKDPDSVSVPSHLKSWVKSRGFRLANFPEKNLMDVLVKPARYSKTSSTAESPELLTVLHARALYDVVKHVHSVIFEHGGYKRVLSYMQTHYFGATRGYVQQFCSTCPVCKSHKRRIPQSLYYAEQVISSTDDVEADSQDQYSGEVNSLEVIDVDEMSTAEELSSSVAATSAACLQSSQCPEDVSYRLLGLPARSRSGRGRRDTPRQERRTLSGDRTRTIVDGNHVYLVTLNEDDDLEEAASLSKSSGKLDVEGKQTRDARAQDFIRGHFLLNHRLGRAVGAVDDPHVGQTTGDQCQGVSLLVVNSEPEYGNQMFRNQKPETRDTSSRDHLPRTSIKQEAEEEQIEVAMEWPYRGILLNQVKAEYGTGSSETAKDLSGKRTFREADAHPTLTPSLTEVGCSGHKRWASECANANSPSVRRLNATTATPPAAKAQGDTALGLPMKGHDQMRSIQVESSQFFNKVHVDIIDMSHSPDNSFNFICHVTDHSRKLHVLFPLQQASAAVVAPVLDQRVLAYYGMPRNLHSNRGYQFVEELILALSGIVEGGVACSNGEPVQLTAVDVEDQGTNVVEELIAMLTVERSSSSASSAVPWLSWLPRIMRSLNRDWHTFLRTTNTSSLR